MYPTEAARRASDGGASWGHFVHPTVAFPQRDCSLRCISCLQMTTARHTQMVRASVTNPKAKGCVTARIMPSLHPGGAHNRIQRQCQLNREPPIRTRTNMSWSYPMTILCFPVTCRTVCCVPLMPERADAMPSRTEYSHGQPWGPRSIAANQQRTRHTERVCIPDHPAVEVERHTCHAFNIINLHDISDRQTQGLAGLLQTDISDVGAQCRRWNIQSAQVPRNPEEMAYKSEICPGRLRRACSGDHPIPTLA